MKKKILLNYIIDLDIFIENYIYKEKINKKNYKKIFLCVVRSQPIIKFFIFCHLILFKIFTLSVKNQKIKFYIFKILFKYNLFKFEKIIQLIFALKQISYGSNEKIIRNSKKKIKFYEKTYYENIVVGSGPSGSITGLKLSSKGYSIPKYKHPFNEFKEKWKYAGISGALCKYDFQYASAECVGGGSEINSGLYHELDEEYLKR